MKIEDQPGEYDWTDYRFYRRFQRKLKRERAVEYKQGIIWRRDELLPKKGE